MCRTGIGKILEGLKFDRKMLPGDGEFLYVEIECQGVIFCIVD